MTLRAQATPSRTGRPNLPRGRGLSPPQGVHCAGLLLRWPCVPICMCIYLARGLATQGYQPLPEKADPTAYEFYTCPPRASFVGFGHAWSFASYMPRQYEPLGATQFGEDGGRCALPRFLYPTRFLDLSGVFQPCTGCNVRSSSVVWLCATRCRLCPTLCRCCCCCWPEQELSCDVGVCESCSNACTLCMLCATCCVGLLGADCSESVAH